MFAKNSLILRLLPISVALSLIIVLSGCQSMMPDEDKKPAYRVELHIDGNLDFSMEHPEKWPEVPPTVAEYDRLKQSVRWSSVKEGDRQKGALVTVTSRLPEEIGGGFPTMVRAYLAEHPRLTLLKQQSFDHPAAPAYELMGTEGTRTLQVFFLTSPHRAFTLEFSAPTEAFAQFAEIFSEMLLSFRPLS